MHQNEVTWWKAAELRYPHHSQHPQKTYRQESPSHLSYVLATDAYLKKNHPSLIHEKPFRASHLCYKTSSAFAWRAPTLTLNCYFKGGGTLLRRTWRTEDRNIKNLKNLYTVPSKILLDLVYFRTEADISQNFFSLLLSEKKEKWSSSI